jgi:molybdate transport system substrate-binding protein
MVRQLFGITAQVLLGASICAAGICMSTAAEIKILSANGMRDVLAEMTVKFEAASVHKLAVTVSDTDEIRKRVLAGEPYDVIIVPNSEVQELEKAGKIAPSSAVALVRLNFGIGVPAAGPKHDISTPDTLKNTFLRARTVLFADPKSGATSGVHLLEVLNKLGIADEMKSRLIPQTGAFAERVVKGEADLAVQAEHEIRCIKGATFLAYPTAFQRTIIFMGGIGAGTKAAEAAKEYLAFMTGSEAATTYTKHCLTPG